VTSDWRQVTEPKALVVSPVEELTNGARIRSAHVLVADIGREEFNEAVLSSSAGSRDYCWQVFPAQTDQARRHDHDCFRFHQSIPISELKVRIYSCPDCSQVSCAFVLLCPQEQEFL